MTDHGICILAGSASQSHMHAIVVQELSLFYSDLPTASMHEQRRISGPTT
jgi:hypothetical protein